MYNDSISTNNLTIGYPGHPVHEQLNFSLVHGEVVCLLGPNGAGKSTLLRTLAGLQPPLDGHVSIQGDRVTRMSLVLTEHDAVESATVHDVVALGRYPYVSFLAKLSKEDEQIILSALRDVGSLAEDENAAALLSRPFVSLSDGEKQRVLIAKALAQQTDIILLDEPTAHLDLPNRIRTFQLLQRLAHEQHKTILISTHELDLALQYADRVLLMAEGRMWLDTPKTLYDSDAFTQAFGMAVPINSQVLR